MNDDLKDQPEQDQDSTSQGWVEIPVLRGIFEIEPLLDLCERHGGRIIGGYARFCCSPREVPVRAQDVDLFPIGDSDEQCQKVFESMKAELLEAGLKEKSENNVSITLDAENVPPYNRCPRIQLIKPIEDGAILTRGTVEQVLENFDFTVVRVALKRNRRTATAWASFLEDEQKQKLRILNIHCPISSLLRVMKYARKGYYMRPVEAIKLFQDWEMRSPQYRQRIGTLFSTGQFGKITKEEIDELETLLRVD